MEETEGEIFDVIMTSIMKAKLCCDSQRWTLWFTSNTQGWLLFFLLVLQAWFYTALTAVL